MIVPLCKFCQQLYILAIALISHFQIRQYVDQSEIAPKELRGRLITMQQFAITIGIAVAFWINFGTINWEGSQSWR